MASKIVRDPELQALTRIIKDLEALAPEERRRTLAYLCSRYQFLPLPLETVPAAPLPPDRPAG